MAIKEGFCVGTAEDTLIEADGSPVAGAVETNEVSGADG